MEFAYQILNPDTYPDVFERMQNDGLLWPFFPELGSKMDVDTFCALYSRPDLLLLGGFIDGDLAGVLSLCPYRPATRVGEIGLCAFRKSFSDAPRLCVGALLWCFDRLDLAALVGHVPATSHHVMWMLDRVGFRRVVRLPDLMWLDRRGRFVDGWVVVAERKNVEDASTIMEE